MHNRADNNYTVNDLMEILGVTRRTILTYIKQKRIRAFKLGNQWRVTEEELQNFIKRNSNY